jgi:hypothetical protein
MNPHLQGATANLARLPLVFQSKDKMQKVQDPHIAALSVASISAAPAATIHIDFQCRQCWQKRRH